MDGAEKEESLKLSLWSWGIWERMRKEIGEGEDQKHDFFPSQMHSIGNLEMPAMWVLDWNSVWGPEGGVPQTADP